jgi:restriction endonuclease S subunit
LEFSKRIDSEYYKKEFLQYEIEVKKQIHFELQSLASFLIGPFGSSFDTDHYINNGLYRYIRGQDVKPFILQDCENRYIPKEDFERLKRYELKKNDILISVVGTIGNACLVQENDLPAIFSCKSTVIRTNEINPIYLLSYFNSKFGHNLLLRKQRGAIQKGLNLEDLKSVPVVFPSHMFQSKIESVFWQAQENLRQSKIQYCTAKNSLYSFLKLNDWKPSYENITVKKISQSFGVFGRLDSEFYMPYFEEMEDHLKKLYGCVNIEQICSEINYGTVPTSPYTDDESGIPYIKGSNLKNTLISNEGLDKLKYTDNLDEKYFTKEGDIIISQMGTVGDTGVVAKNQEGWLFASFTIRIRIKDKERFDPTFIGFYIQHIAKPYYLHRYIAQASVRQNTDLPTIKKMYIPNLPIEKQRIISRYLYNNFVLYNRSVQLLNITKKAVEIAIEKTEKDAIDLLIKTAQKDA